MGPCRGGVDVLAGGVGERAFLVQLLGDLPHGRALAPPEDLHHRRLQVAEIAGDGVAALPLALRAAVEGGHPVDSREVLGTGGRLVHRSALRSLRSERRP